MNQTALSFLLIASCSLCIGTALGQITRLDSTGTARTYENKQLGISFQYGIDYDPFSKVAEASDDTAEWKTCSSERFGIQFRYPKQLLMRVVACNHPVYSPCDSAIQLGNLSGPKQTQGSLLGSLKPVITIYWTLGSLDQIATGEGFDRFQDLQNLNGREWQGLRREGYSIRNGQYVEGSKLRGSRRKDLVYVSLFLTHKKKDDSWIVLSFKYWAKEKRTVINENEFYLMLLSLKFLN